jgi:hypothetical protein
LDTLKLKNPKPEQRFFDGYLDNDLEALSTYLTDIHQKMITGEMFGLSKDQIPMYNDLGGGTPTQLGQYYNIFTFDNESIQKLKSKLRDVMQDACEYYGIDFEQSDYRINGWFNLDYGTKYGNYPNNQSNKSNYHDHMDGKGAPVFHGYYCVSAEPSITHYLINREAEVDNINKNNRLVVSETGHPHNIGNWDWEGPRITIAYDISPYKEGYVGPNWIKL